MEYKGRGGLGNFLDMDIIFLFGSQYTVSPGPMVRLLGLLY